jgi:hypothetical protein
MQSKGMPQFGAQKKTHEEYAVCVLLRYDFSYSPITLHYKAKIRAMYYNE